MRGTKLSMYATSSVGGIGREFKLQSPAPVVIDFQNEFHVPVSTLVFIHEHRSPLSQPLSIVNGGQFDPEMSDQLSTTGL